MYDVQVGRMPLHSSSEDDDPDFNNIQFPQDTAMQQVSYFLSWKRKIVDFNLIYLRTP